MKRNLISFDEIVVEVNWKYLGVLHGLLDFIRQLLRVNVVCSLLLVVSVRVVNLPVLRGLLGLALLRGLLGVRLSVSLLGVVLNRHRGNRLRLLGDLLLLHSSLLTG